MINVKGIKKRMIDCGLTTAELADKFGLSVPYTSSVINGKRTLTLHVAESIQQALGIPNELFGHYFLKEQKGTEDDNQPTEPASTASRCC